MGKFWKIAGKALMTIIGVFAPPLSILYNLVKTIIKPKIENFLSLGISFVSGFTSSLFDSGGIIDDIDSSDFGAALAEGLVSDAIEIGNLAQGVESIVPYNQISQKCDVCGNYSSFYVIDDGFKQCKKCLEKKIDKQITVKDKIYVYQNGIYNAKSSLIENASFDTKFNSAYYDLKSGTNKFSDSYYEFKKRKNS